MLTLITDASYNGPGCGGWAAWVKADGQEQHLTGGVLVAPVATCGEAELEACLRGLLVALGYAPGHDVLLQSDSMHALRILKDRLRLRESAHVGGSRVQGLPKVVTRLEEALVQEFRAAMWSARVSVLVRHVKGHVRNGKGRYWVNAQCDRVAREHMMTARRALVGVV